jgi:hypothetical protein
MSNSKAKLSKKYIMFGIASALVIAGLWLQDYGLKTDSLFWQNVSPDIFGSGLFVFVLTTVLIVLKIKLGKDYL